MNCATCDKEIVLFGQENPKFLTVSPYWSFEDDGVTIRPYCGSACGLVDYTQKQAEKDSPPQQP